MQVSDEVSDVKKLFVFNHVLYSRYFAYIVVGKVCMAYSNYSNYSNYPRACARERFAQSICPSDVVDFIEKIPSDTLGGFCGIRRC